MQGQSQNGVLYVVATPIGNLDDMSFRAVDVLRHVELIVVEDKRQSVKLLQHFNIQGPTYSLHDHNERENSVKLVEKLQSGGQIALISDAGTPLVSDPGYVLVNAAIEKGISVIPIPGPCALVAALCVSGLPTDRFCFEGFLPAKSTARKQKLEHLKTEPRTLIFYEAPHRIVESLGDMATILGDQRRSVLARELTKTFETLARKPLKALHDWVVADENQQKGEMVVIVEGKVSQPDDSAAHDDLLLILLDELPLKQAVSVASKISGAKKNALYDRALELKESK